MATSLASNPGTTIAHPATQRQRGPWLTGYLVFCAVRGVLQLLAVWFFGQALPRAGGIGGVGPIGLALAMAGALNALGALALWQWSGAGVVLLALAAGATIVAGALGGWTLSVVFGGVMLVGAAVAWVVAPWRLNCLRCRSPLTATDAVCPSCGQAFVG